MTLTFEWTFRAGDVLTFVGGCGVIAAFLFRSGGSVGRLEAAMTRCIDEISEMKSELSEFGRALTRLSVQETKTDLLMKWYDELRSGKGFIQGGRGIDHEWPGQ